MNSRIGRYPRRAAGLARAALLVLSLFPAASAVAAPEKIDQLIVRMWPGPWGDAMEDVGKEFTAKTGIPVVYDRRVDGVMLTVLQVAAAQHRPPPIDVFYTFDIEATRAQMRGITQPMTVAEVPNLADMLPIAKPPNSGDAWPYVNVGADVVTLLYRADKFPDGPPTSYAAMLEPRFKGRIFFYSTSAFAISFVAALEGWNVPGDMDKIWQFMRDKVKPQNPILGNDPDLVGGLQRDEIDLAVSYPTIARQLKSSGIKWTMAKEGLIGGNEAVAIPKNLPAANRYWATQFVNMLLSPDTLQHYCDRLLIACYRKGMTVPDAEKDDPAFPKTPEDLAKIHEIPVKLLATHQSEWDAKYDEIMK